MEPIIIRFEANCPCLWGWDTEDQCLTCTDVFEDSPSMCKEIWGDKAVCDACYPLEEEYDKLCFDEHGGFYPNGWNSEEQMKAFNQKMIDLWEFLNEHFKGRYKVYIHAFFDDVDDCLSCRSREPVL